MSSQTPSLLGHKLHTHLDLINPDWQTCEMMSMFTEACHGQHSYKRHFNIGQKHWARNWCGGHNWITGVVTEIHGLISYWV